LTVARGVLYTAFLVGAAARVGAAGARAKTADRRPVAPDVHGGDPRGARHNRMNRRSLVLVPCAAVMAGALVQCGGSSSSPTSSPSPAVSIAAATPAPTAAAKPLSVIPTCKLAASSPASLECDKRNSRLSTTVNASIDRALRERPELFNPDNVNGGPQVLNVEAYMTAVVAAIGETGACAKIEPEGEIAVKGDNGASEQWIIVSRVGWGVPTDHWLQRKYIGTCYPATF
jgi:hypothetical protein